MTYLIGIGGISGSGKGTFASALKNGLELCCNDGQNLKGISLTIDDFYADIGYMTEEERNAYCVDPELNFDHPDMIDWKRLRYAAKALKEGRAFNYDHYNFKLHCYKDSTTESVPAELDFAIIEGILALYDAEIIDRYDYSFYVITDPVLSAVRRYDRDTAIRGRDAKHVGQQISTTVVPMQRKFVEPTRFNAVDLIDWEANEALGSVQVRSTLCDIVRQKTLFLYEKITRKDLLPRLNPKQLKIDGLSDEQDLTSSNI